MQIYMSADIYIYEILFLQLKLNRMRVKVTWLTPVYEAKKMDNLESKTILPHF